MKNWDDILAAAEAGDAEAQLTAAAGYYAGEEGLERDLDRAIAWTRKAAEQGHPEALFRLAYLHKTGEGVPRNSAASRELYEKAAGGGSAKARYNLAVMYLTGDGVEKDPARGLSWLEAAAETGFVKAQLLLARFRVSGVPEAGIEPDLAQGARWYLSAAEAGNVDAQVMIGSMYMDGVGVPANREKAMSWLRAAAEQGSQQAHYALRLMTTLPMAEENGYAFPPGE